MEMQHGGIIICTPNSDMQIFYPLHGVVDLLKDFGNALNVGV